VNVTGCRNWLGLTDEDSAVAVTALLTVRPKLAVAAAPFASVTVTE
jgi:hypothetical protein